MRACQNGLRASLATLVGGRPEEVALTTGASAGTATLAYGMPWKPGDEVLTSTGEFPLPVHDVGAAGRTRGRGAARGVRRPARFSRQRI